MAKAAALKPDRRDQIARALYKCIGDKGYANTSLKDIACAAEMSPSHLGYYFDNKAAILEYYAQGICDQTVANLPDLHSVAAPQLIGLLANFCLGPGQMSTQLSGVIQELAGLAVHDHNLHAVKAQHSRFWRQYLEDFFSLVGVRDGLTAQVAAWQLHATIVGLNTNLLYDKSLDREQAYELLNGAMHFLSGTKQDKQIELPSVWRGA